MSKPVIWFRAFNAFIERFVSIWAIGYIVVPWILTLIITGFFGFPVTVPLIAICCIVGAVALICGGLTAYWRYQYLGEQSNKLLNKYVLRISSADPDSDQIPLNTVILVQQEGKPTEVYFKRNIRNKYVPINVEINLTPAEEEIIQQHKISQENPTYQPAKGKKTIKRHPVINDIIQRVLSERGSIFNRPEILQQGDKLPPAHQRMITWERINAFFCDAPTIFAFATIILLIIHIFSGALIPATLLIAVILSIASIAYGVLSAFIRDAQVDSKLKAMTAFKDEYETTKKKADTLVAETNTYIAKIDNLIAKLNEPNQQQQHLIAELIQFKQMLGMKIENLALLQKELPEIYNKSHLKFTDKEIFRVIYALFYGHIIAGAFFYVALPIALSGLGFAPLSMPVLIVIIVAVGFLYGIYNMYHKKHLIQEEKWANMDDEKIRETSENIDEVNRTQLKPTFEQLETILAQDSKLVSSTQAVPPVDDGPKIFSLYDDYIKPFQITLTKGVTTVTRQYNNFFGKSTPENQSFSEVESTTFSDTNTFGSFK